MIASMMWAFARTSPRTPPSRVRLWPSVNRLTYSSDVLQPVQEEDDADQEEQMVVAGHHVFGAEVEKRCDCDPVDGLDEVGVAR